MKKVLKVLSVLMAVMLLISAISVAPFAAEAKPAINLGAAEVEAEPGATVAIPVTAVNFAEKNIFGVSVEIALGGLTDVTLTKGSIDPVTDMNVTVKDDVLKLAEIGEVVDSAPVYFNDGVLFTINGTVGTEGATHAISVNKVMCCDYGTTDADPVEVPVDVAGTTVTVKSIPKVPSITLGESDLVVEPGAVVTIPVTANQFGKAQVFGISLDINLGNLTDVTVEAGQIDAKLDFNVTVKDGVLKLAEIGDVVDSNVKYFSDGVLFTIKAKAGKNGDVHNVSIVKSMCCNYGDETSSPVEVTVNTDSKLNVTVKSTHVHSYTSEVTKRPTIKEPGVITYTCECGDTYTEEVKAIALEFGKLGYNISLNSSIDIAFTVPNEYVTADNVSDCYAVVSKDLFVGADVVETDVQNFEKSAFLNHNAKKEKFVYSGVTAKDMSNNINVVFYVQFNDNTFGYLTLDFKLTDYIDGVLDAYEPTAETNVKNRQLLTLLMDMAVYGSKAQAQFNYNTANDVAAKYTDSIAKYATTSEVAYNTAFADKSLDGATHKLLSTLSVESSITIRSEVRLSDNTKIADLAQLDGYYAKVVINGDKANAIRIDAKDFNCNGVKTYIDYSGFTTREKANTAEFTLYDVNNNVVSNSRMFSIESYAYQIAVEAKLPVGNSLRDLSDAMVRFLTSAELYFA